MQIQFDPRDRNACAAVLAAIIGLHGELPTIGNPAIEAEWQDCNGLSADETADPADPADAFAGAAAPEQAFPPVTAAPTAPPATSAPLPPAGTQDVGTAATTPPAGADNGQAAAPTASPSSAAPAGVETDKNGLPWDKRIHAGKENDKKKVADGSWRKRRGVADDLVTQVEAELRQIMAAPGPNASPAAPPAAASPEPAPAPAPTAAPVAPPPTPADAGTASGPDVAATASSAPPPPPVATPPAAAPAAPPVQAATPIEPAAPAPAPAATDGPLTLPVLMRKITALQTAGTLDVAGTNAIAVSLGLTSVRDLVQRPDLIASFDALLPEQAA